MKIVFGTIVTDGRGSIGGTVFSRNANSAYTRIKTQPINPNTIPQQVQRANFRATTASWRQLTIVQQNSFIASTPSYPYVNKVGVTSKYTGFQLFNKLNTQLRSVGQSPIALCNPPDTLQGIYIRSALVTPGVSIFLDIQFGDDVDPTVPDGTVLVIQATSSLSLGVNSPKAKNFRTIAFAAAAVDTTTLNVISDWEDIFGSFPDTSTVNVYFQVFYVDVTTGQATPKIFVLANTP
jgi:hypothetical protein